MPVVRINDVTFSHISTLKTWYKTKSPSETIDRIVREVMEDLGIEHNDEIDSVPVKSDGSPRIFDVAPSLAFTKPVKATIDGEIVKNPNWASILLVMIAHVKAKGFEGEKLVRKLGVPSKAASYTQNGYKYAPELGISVQGQSAADAWNEVARLAKRWSIPAEVEFIWRQNPKALHPGEMGVLRSGDS